jgi:hypothetical protein
MGEGMRRTSLKLPQVHLILRIYYTDRYQRRDLGLQRATPGLYDRLARQFGVSREVIKKIVSIRENQYGWPRRKRFPSIALKSIKRNVKNRKANRYGQSNPAPPERTK